MIPRTVYLRYWYVGHTLESLREAVETMDDER